MINSITSFTGKSSIRKSSKNKWIDYKSAYIDINKILKVKDYASITNYSFSITVDDSPVNEFYNLIVNEDNAGNVKSPYVIKYVVDDDALDDFLMNDKDFRYFKGRQYIMPFQDFFQGVGVFSKSSSTTSDCIIETGINNTGNGGNGDFYDIPNDHPLKTDPNAYDYAQYEYGESYKLVLNTYGGTTGNTSYQETVRDEQFPVSALTSQGYSQYAINVPISSTISPPTGVTVTSYYNSQGSLTSITITTYYGGGGSSTKLMRFFALEPEDHLDKQTNIYKSQIDCAGIDGEIGVNTIDLGRSVASALGIVPRTEESLWLVGKTVNKASLLELISLTDYIAQNTNSQDVLDPEAKEFGNLAVEAMVDDAEVDFEEQIINELTGKEKCLHDLLDKNGSTYIKDLMAKFKGNSTFDIKIVSKEIVTVIDDNGNIKEVNGTTSYTSTGKLITINISTSKANDHSALEAARTILHEYIHADIFRKLDTKYNANIELDFKKTYESYKDQHEIMGEVYVTSMRDVMKDFHKNVLTEDYNKYIAYYEEEPSDAFYEALAWRGLAFHNVKAWTDLSPERQTELNNLSGRVQLLTKNVTCPE